MKFTKAVAIFVVVLYVFLWILALNGVSSLIGPLAVPLILVALVALRFAAIPADANHPFGHDKAEFFAAVIEGVLIIVAALSISRMPGTSGRTRNRWPGRSRAWR